MQPRRGATIQCEARIGMQHEAVSTASSDSMVRAAIADSSTRPRTHKTASNELLRDVCFTSKSGHAQRRHQCPLCANSGHLGTKTTPMTYANIEVT
jgi:hypothetical protein